MNHVKRHAAVIVETAVLQVAVFVHVAACEALREQAHVAFHARVRDDGHKKTNILDKVVSRFHAQVDEVLHRPVGLVANGDVGNREVLAGGGDDGHVVVDRLDVAHTAIDDAVVDARPDFTLLERFECVDENCLF